MGSKDIRMGNSFLRWATKILGWAIYFHGGQEIIRMGRKLFGWADKRCRWAGNFHDGQLNDSDGQVLRQLIL